MQARPLAGAAALLGEARLIQLAQGGDLDAFDRLVEHHQVRVYNLCLWIVQDPDEAADAAQTAFIRAFRALARFRSEATFGTWIGRIAVNVARDAVRARRTAPIPFSHFEPDLPALDPQSAEPGPELELVQREKQRAVRSALSGLSEDHRVVLVLFDLQGHSYEEAAAILGLRLGTVKSRLNRARAALKAALEPHRELFEGHHASE